MKRLLVAVTLVVAVALAAGACAASRAGDKVQPDRGVEPGFTTVAWPQPPPGTVVVSGAPKEGAQDGSGSGSDASAQPGVTDRMIIRTANIDLVVDNVVSAVERIAQLAGQSGGYVVSSKTFGEGKKLAGTISIRVPAEQFDSTMRSLRSMAVKVLSQDESTRDVSEEYVDLQSRLRNLEATEQQLLRLLEKAATVDDTLAVQRELNRVRGEIEQTKGRMQFLERSSETSLINVGLQGAGLDAEFGVSATEVETGDEVRFADFTSGGEPPYSYEWSFGDGATSDLKHPVHKYLEPGNYTVSLKVTDDKGLTDTETKKALVSVSRAPGWGLGGVFGQAGRALAALGKAVATGLVYVVVFVVPVGLAVLAVWWVVRWALRTRRKAA